MRNSGNVPYQACACGHKGVVLLPPTRTPVTNDYPPQATSFDKHRIFSKFRFLSFEVCEKREVLSWVCEVSDRAAASSSWNSEGCASWTFASANSSLSPCVSPDEPSVLPRSASSALCSDSSDVLTGCPCHPLGNP